MANWIFSQVLWVFVVNYTHTHTHTHTHTGSEGPQSCRPNSNEERFCADTSQGTSDRDCDSDKICTSECECWDGARMRDTNTPAFTGGNGIDAQGIVQCFTIASNLYMYAWLLILHVIPVAWMLSCSIDILQLSPTTLVLKLCLNFHYLCHCMNEWITTIAIIAIQ